MGYVDVCELQRVLNKPTPTAAELDAMQGRIDVAAQEINWDLGYTVENPAPPTALALLADVNLDRAAELWKANFSAYGILPVGPEQVPIVSPKNTWYRYHLRLNPLRTTFAIG